MFETVSIFNKCFRQVDIKTISKFKEERCTTVRHGSNSNTMLYATHIVASILVTSDIANSRVVLCIII